MILRHAIIFHRHTLLALSYYVSRYGMLLADGAMALCRCHCQLVADAATHAFTPLFDAVIFSMMFTLRLFLHAFSPYQRSQHAMPIRR